MHSRLSNYNKLAIRQRIDHVVTTPILGLERQRVAVTRVALSNQKRADFFIFKKLFGLSKLDVNKLD